MHWHWGDDRHSPVEMDRTHSTHIWPRLPKPLPCGELSASKRSQGGQRKRFKDSLKNNLKRFDIDTGLWESAAADRSRWRTAIRKGSLLFESNRRRDLSDKLLQRKHHETEARVRLSKTSPDFICTHYGSPLARTITHALASSTTIAHIGLNRHPRHIRNRMTTQQQQTRPI